ncbi:hypothetical protein PABG_06723 [Paracoccidioides brasiliensis Pb03]|nr:hypothetical protein PABG_06723 [Paracoccidioides brasiliensis Pb03]
MAKRSRDKHYASESADSSGSPQPGAPTMQSPTSPRGKLVHLNDQNENHGVMRCTLPPHREAVSFSTYEDYEVHYAQTHVNRCSACGKNFPTAHFLTLHIEEHHDPLIAARREKGEKTFTCFVEGCDRKCSTFQKRRMHLIDKHLFPRVYNFAIVNTGIDKHDSMLRGGTAPAHLGRVTVPNLTQHESRLRRWKSSQSTPSENMDSDKHSSTLSNNKISNSNASLDSSLRTAQLPVYLKSAIGSRSTSVPARREAAASTGNREPNSSVNTDKGHDVAELERSMSALRFIPMSVILRLNEMKEQ